MFFALQAQPQLAALNANERALVWYARVLGEPITRCAELIGVTRMTLYRWTPAIEQKIGAEP